MSTTTTKATTKPHPLEAAVLASYEGRTAHDRITLADALKGPGRPRGKRAATCSRAYLAVAEDVLRPVERRGVSSVDDE